MLISIGSKKEYLLKNFEKIHILNAILLVTKAKLEKLKEIILKLFVVENKYAKKKQKYLYLK